MPKAAVSVKAKDQKVKKANKVLKKSRPIRVISGVQISLNLRLYRQFCIIQYIVM